MRAERPPGLAEESGPHAGASLGPSDGTVLHESTRGSFPQGRCGWTSGPAELKGDAYRGVGRQASGAEQLVRLLPVGVQHGLEPLHQLGLLLLQLPVAALQLPHACLLPGQPGGETAGGGQPLRPQASAIPKGAGATADADRPSEGAAHCHSLSALWRREGTERAAA